jgi:hypothetical protein
MQAEYNSKKPDWNISFTFFSSYKTTDYQFSTLRTIFFIQNPAGTGQIKEWNNDRWTQTFLVILYSQPRGINDDRQSLQKLKQRFNLNSVQGNEIGHGALPKDFTGECDIPGKRGRTAACAARQA